MALASAGAMTAMVWLIALFIGFALAWVMMSVIERWKFPPPRVKRVKRAKANMWSWRY